MIIVRKAKKKDKSLLIEFKLMTINPYIKDNKDKLKVISYVNRFIDDNYNKAYLIYRSFKLIGGYLIVDDVLDIFYIKEEYRNKGNGSKVFKRIRNKFDKIWVMKENKEALNFYKKFGFEILKEEKNRYLLRS